MDELPKLSAYAELTEAAYASLPKGTPPLAALIDAGMSDAEAKRFAAMYSVVDSYADPSGVSATIFEDSKGNQYLTIRGTEVTSLADLGADYILANGWPPELNPQFISLRNQINLWLANGAIRDHFSVAGHSLGGFLAAGVALNYGARVGSTYTFNAPGIGGIGPALLPSLRTLLGLPTSSTFGKYFNIRDGSGISVAASLGAQLTPPILIDTEQQIAPWDNHKIGVLADALAVYGLAGRLDPAVSTETVGRILRNAGATESGEEEDAINALNRTLRINTRVQCDDRNGFWTATTALESDSAVKTLFGKLVVSTPGFDATSATAAKTDFGDFVALKTLSPFALHAKAGVAGAQSALDAVWLAAHGPDLVNWTSDKIDRSSGGATDELTFTDEWYRDRAGLLQAILKSNEDDTQGLAHVPGAPPNVKPEYRYYVDGIEQILLADPVPVSPKANPQLIAFADDAGRTLAGTDQALGDLLHGGAGGDTLTGLSGDDYLEGNAGSDVLDGGANRDELYGGADNDILRGGSDIDQLTGGTGDDALTGGTGDDQLDGGAGNDSYLFAVGDGDDTIDDSDGAGELRIGAAKLVGGNALTNGLWQQTVNGKTVLYGWNPAADGRGDLLIQSEVGLTTVKHFANGELGITLDAYVPGTIHVPLTGNSVIGTALDDNRSAAGHPPIVGGAASDRVQGLAGRDEVYGRAGDDVVVGGAGIDVAAGEDGNDAVFADNELTPANLRAYIDSSATSVTAGTMPAQLSIATSEWLQGGLGDDTVAGADGNDILFGGGGKDLLVGGAGHDVIDGDDDYAPGDVTTVTIQPGIGPGTPFDVFYSSVNVKGYAGTDGAADEIHGGSGDDWVLGQIGDDDLWGDDGNDTISGGENSDVIFGGRGDDRIAGDTYGLVVGDSPAIPFGSDYIDGGEGNDDISGDGGADTIVGGAGNDSLRGNNGRVGANHLSETSADDGNDHLDGGDGADTLIGDAKDDTLLGGNGNDALMGDSDQTEAAYHGNDYLDGGAGDDYLRGYGGNDTLLGGDGDDRLLGEGGDDYLDGGTRGYNGDALSGGDGNDVLKNGTWLMGDAGDDVLTDGDQMWGGDGNDTLSNGESMMGGNGDDTLTTVGRDERAFGEAGADTLLGGADVDELSGGADGDLIIANAGDDLGWGDEGDDELHGGAGNDQLQGGTGNDLLYGEEDDDALFGQEGDDTLSGGQGRDYLLGGAGNDTYLVDSDIGKEVIIDTEGANIVRFADGITSGQLTFRPGIDELGNDRYLVIEGFAGGGRVVVSGGLDGTVGNFEFSDGTSLTATQARDLALAPTTRPPRLVSMGVIVGPVSIVGDAGDNVIRIPAPGHSVIGGDGNDTLTGSAGQDALYGGKGDDRLDGGAGDDRLQAGDGADTYVFGRGSGNDIIGEQHALGTTGPETDTLELGAGVLPADVRLVRDGNDFVVMLDNGPTQARLQAFYVTATDNKIEQIRFADGTLWNAAQIAARTESGTPNAMTGTAGDDTFVVDSGQDTVMEAANGGNDTIRSSVSYVQPANVETLVLSGNLDSSAWANPSNAVSYLVGNDGNNVFDGPGVIVDRDGNVIGWSNPGQTGAYAVMSGGKGDDTYYYDFNKGGQAIENPGEGNDTIVLTHGAGYFTLPANVENVRDINGGFFRVGGDTPDSLIGNDLDNFLGYVGARADMAYYIDGGRGADTMQGAERDDVYIVDNARDRVIESPNSGTDEIRSSISYELPDYVENLTLTGTNAIDGWGNALDNRIDGAANTAGNTLTGGAGDDYYVAGPNDTVVENPDEGNDTVEFHGTGTRTYTMADVPANVEALVLGDDLGAANLQGDAGDNTLTANASDNEIEGGAGDDTLHGGDGADTYRFGKGFGNDTVLETGAGNHVVFDATISPDDVRFDRGRLRIDGTGDSLLAGFEPGDWGYYSPYDVQFADGSTITATRVFALLTASLSATPTDGVDLLNGTAGADTLDALGGDDYLFGFEGDDALAGGAGMDELHGDAGDDTLDGGADSDQLYGGDGNDVLTAGDDAGPSGIANTLYGDGGDDTLQGGGGPDALAGGDGADVLRAGEGDDSLSGGAGNDTLEGGAGNDYIVDEAGNDTLRGGDGDDILQAYAGDDVLDGGAGADNLQGGPGVDTYVLAPGGGVDTVMYENWYLGELSVVQADAALHPADVSLDRVDDANGANVVVSANGGADALWLQGLYADTPVEIRFADGTVWDSATVFDKLYARRGTPGSDTLTAGASGDYQLYGYAGNDTLTGGGGNDLLDGGSGADSMTGGAGSDTYVVDDPGDAVVEAGVGYDTVKASIGYVLPANVEALVLTGASAINATGNALNNALTGNGANNVLDGKAGADTLKGGAGNDTYVVDNAGDVVVENANEGTDLVQSSVAYTLGANLENLTLAGAAAIAGTGNAGDNILVGNAAANTLTGGAGNDQLDGGAGADTLKGGTGDDAYTVDNASDVTIENAGEGVDTARASVTYTIGANVENLVLTGAGAINGTGNASNNTLTGNAAANTLNGGAGADAMAGGLGNDTYVVDNAGDVVTENAGEGTDLVQASVTYTLGANVENLTLTGAAAINATGNALANALTGNGGNNVLDGGGGADTMAGGLGNDTYVVDANGDVVTEAASAGTDLVQSAISYTVGANVENLTLIGTSNLNATGNAVNNALTGNSGNNVLDGGAGADAMAGGSGDDTYVVDNAGDVVTEAAGAGFDAVQSTLTYTLGANLEYLTLTSASAINGTGNALDNWLKGNSAANALDGGGGNDTLWGGDGNDTLQGGAGNDLLQGGLGNDALADAAGNALLDGDGGSDTLTGGAAHEIFVGGAGVDTITTGGGADVIAFNRGDGADTVNASAGSDDTLTVGGGIAYSDMRLGKSGLDLIFDAGSGDQIVFKNWYQGGVNDKSVLNLQVIADAMAGFNPGGADPLLKKKIATFNFGGIVGAFDAALAADPTITRWSVSNALAGFYLSGSDTAAIGGDFAYDYGHRNALTNIGATAGQSVLAAPAFGSGAQALQPTATLYSGTVRLQ